MGKVEGFGTIHDLVFAIYFIAAWALAVLLAVGLTPPYLDFIPYWVPPLTAVIGLTILIDAHIRDPRQLIEPWRTAARIRWLITAAFALLLFCWPVIRLVYVKARDRRQKVIFPCHLMIRVVLSLLFAVQEKYFRSTIVLRTMLRLNTPTAKKRSVQKRRGSSSLPEELRVQILRLAIAPGRIQLPQIYQATLSSLPNRNPGGRQRPSLTYRVLHMLDRLTEDSYRYMPVRNVLEQSITSGGWCVDLASILMSVIFAQRQAKSNLG